MSPTPSVQPPASTDEDPAVVRLLRGSSDPRLIALIDARGVDEGARAYVEELRWPDGATCPRCDSSRVGWLEVRRKRYCRDCHYQFRVTAGTVFHDSHVSLPRWLVSVQLILESDEGFPANRLQTVIGGSYKTAWFVGHRIRAAMSRSLFSLEVGVPLAFAQFIDRAGPPPGEETAPAPGGPAARGFGLVKSLVAGAYHRPSIEYLTVYWDETRWRAAHAGNERVFRDTIHALLDAEPLPYELLIDRSKPYARPRRLARTA